MSEKTYIDGLIENARKAQAVLEGYTQEQVDALVRAMGKVIYDNAEIIAKEAVEESKEKIMSGEIVPESVREKDK